MQIREYARPKTLEEAFAILTRHKSNRIIGGCTFLNRTGIKIGTAIDLLDCDLDYIRVDGDMIAIGAYTSLRAIEQSALVQEWYGGALQDAIEHLIGIQLRNAITIGAHVASRFGFSDIIPTLLALQAKVRFYHGGTKPLQDFLNEKRPERDILVEVLLPKVKTRCKVQTMRKSYNDYSIFCMAVARSADIWTVAAGVFPTRARLALNTMAIMNASPVNREDAGALAERITGEFSFGTNYRATAEYRQKLCYVFARRGIEELTDADSTDDKRQ